MMMSRYLEAIIVKVSHISFLTLLKSIMSSAYLHVHTSVL